MKRPAAWPSLPSSERRRAWTPGLAGALLLLACAMPAIDLPRDAVDVVVVFDITQSMDVQDVELDGVRTSRLAFARESARRALRTLPCGSRVGWAAFTEYRTLLLLAPIEVCGNYGDLLSTLSHVDGRIRWGNASEISKGVFWAMRAARELAGKPALVFVTDGQESPPLGDSGAPLFDDLAPGQVHGWLAGIGGAVPVRIPRSDAQGRPAGWWRAQDVIQRATVAGRPPSREELSERRDGHLRALAAQVGFDYAALTDASTLARLMHDPRLARRAAVPTDVSWLPALAALMLLAWHFRPQARPRDGRPLSRTSGT
jgi:mxaL protein